MAAINCDTEDTENIHLGARYNDRINDPIQQSQHNGLKGFIAGMLQAFGGSFGAWLLWKLFSNPMQLSFPNADFFV